VQVVTPILPRTRYGESQHGAGRRSRRHHRSTLAVWLGLSALSPAALVAVTANVYEPTVRPLTV